MKKIIAFSALFFLIFSFNIDYLHSALDDFKKDYQKEESGKSRSTHKKNSDSSLSGENESDDWCGDLFPGTFYLWWIFNYNLRYNKYPYQFHDSNNYIFHYQDLSISETEKDEEEQIDKSDNTNKNASDENSDEGIINFARMNKGTGFEDKNYCYTFDTGYQYAFDNGNGIYAEIRGKFYKLIGPEIEYRRLVDDQDHLDYYAIGLNIPIVQFSGFLPDFYFQKIFLKGVIERDGYAWGLIINSYPVKPFSFMLRIGEQSYNNIKGREYANMKFMDYEARAGVVYSRFEIFAGYRHMKAKEAEIKGPEIGVKIFI